MLKCGSYLECKYEIFIFGENKNVDLIIDNDKNPTSQQQDIFIKFEQNKNRCIKSIEESIYIYYLSILEDTRSDPGDVADEEMPIVSHVNELGKLVPPDEIIIRDPCYTEAKIIALLFGCTWDDSHGLGVELTDNEVTGVAQQDIVL